MTINVQIHISGESGGEITNELRALLNGMTACRGEPLTGGVTGGIVTGPAESNAEKPKVTRARRQTAENLATTSEPAAEQPETPAQAEAAVQDAKDEAAETKTPEPEALKLNHDSVRKMLGGYVMAYGMEAAQEDGTKIIGAPKISELADDQKVLAKAVIAIAEAIEKNPYKREIAGDGITKEKTAELKPFVQAAVAAVK